jgi:formylglycine-generating enzyme required for sulfatase activity
MDMKASTIDFESVHVDATGTIVSRTRRTAACYAEELPGGVPLEMVVIPAGEFSMGTGPTAVYGSIDERPQHEVRLSSFCLGRFPVTQQQYRAVVGSNPSMFSGDTRPVESVNWSDAAAFCRRLRDLTNRPYRLPSEAEWEYACRAGTAHPFAFGPMLTADLANYHGEVRWDEGPAGIFRSQTTDVGSFPPNAFGLYDMHGNVFDWCEDTYHENYESAPAHGSAWVTPEISGLRVLRGGSWYHTPIACVATTRLKIQPEYRAPDIGFRVACSLS